eukprot:TRINITY_DN2749_c0_g2_i3.p1 TRINITY_DN2749_c0_g2~~TRINITY_DN2749_c0_g2_i3.p1  ORF type:complete len:1372 (+),score=181.01 TRINITY_DN2749_c0_g2_i3:34-4149(+)
MSDDDDYGFDDDELTDDGDDDDYEIDDYQPEYEEYQATVQNFNETSLLQLEVQYMRQKGYRAGYLVSELYGVTAMVGFPVSDLCSDLILRAAGLHKDLHVVVSLAFPSSPPQYLAQCPGPGRVTVRQSSDTCLDNKQTLADAKEFGLWWTLEQRLLEYLQDKWEPLQQRCLAEIAEAQARDSEAPWNEVMNVLNLAGETGVQMDLRLATFLVKRSAGRFDSIQECLFDEDWMNKLREQAQSAKLYFDDPNWGSFSILNRLVDLLKERIRTCTERCIVCDKPHPLPLLKPVACDDTLCNYQMANLGLGVNLENEILWNEILLNGLMAVMLRYTMDIKSSSTPRGPETEPTPDGPHAPGSTAPPQRTDAATAATPASTAPSARPPARALPRFRLSHADSMQQQDRALTRCYLDDVYATASSPAGLQRLADKLERFADAVGIDLALSKCYTFASVPDPPTVSLCGAALTNVALFDCLGAPLWTTAQPPTTRQWSKLDRIHRRHQDAVAVAGTAAQLRGVVHPDTIASLVAAAALPKAAYGMEVTQFPQSWINACSKAATQSVWSDRAGARRRSRIVVLNALHKGHRLDPATRQLIAPVVAWSRQTRKSNLARGFTRAAFHDRDALTSGPIAHAVGTFRALGWEWVAPLEITLIRDEDRPRPTLNTPQGDPRPPPPPPQRTRISLNNPPQWFAHELRAAALRVRFATLEADRDTFAGVAHGVDGPATRCLLEATDSRALDAYEREVLRSVIAGTVPVAKYRRTQVCTLCDTDAVQDEAHLFLDCPAMSALRHEHWSTIDVASLPACLKLHGILPLRHPFIDTHYCGAFEREELVVAMQWGLINIARRRAELSLAEEGRAATCPPQTQRAYPWQWHPPATQRIANGLAAVFPPAPRNPRTIPRATQLAMAHWLQSLRWETDHLQSPGITYLELAVAFEVDTGLTLPRTNKCAAPKEVKVAENEGRKWVARDRIAPPGTLPGAHLFFDGGARGNGSPHSIAGWGAVLYMDGAKHFDLWRGMPLGTTNNAAEFAGLVAALRNVLAELAPQLIVVHGDSKLVFDTLNKARKDVAPQLRKHWRRAHLVLRQLRQQGFEVQMRHVPREENADADALSNRAMDAKAALVRTGDVSAERARYERRQRASKAKQRTAFETLKRFRALAREDLTPEGTRGEAPHLPTLTALGGPKYTGITRRPVLSPEALAVLRKYKDFHDARRSAAFREKLHADGLDADDAASDDDSEDEVFCPADHYGIGWAAKSEAETAKWQDKADRQLEAWTTRHPNAKTPPVRAPDSAQLRPWDRTTCVAHWAGPCASCADQQRTATQCCASCHDGPDAPPPRWDYCPRHRHTACGKCLVARRRATDCCAAGHHATTKPP